MSVTAQEFRDAAAEAGRRQQAIFYRGDSLADPWLTKVQACLLFAAEQAEQLVMAQDAIAVQCAVSHALRGQLKVAEERPFAIAEALGLLVPETVPYLEDHARDIREQVRTLTARVAELEAKRDEAYEKLTAIAAIEMPFRCASQISVILNTPDEVAK